MNIIKNFRAFGCFLMLACFTACTVSVPEKYIESEKTIAIYPDYAGVAIPYNIAPLNFRVMEEADDCIVRLSTESGEALIYKGKDVKINIDKWHRLLEANKGKNLHTDIFLKNGEEWTKYKAIENYIAPEPIDEYIAYRLIEPSYIVYKKLKIEQRNITNFDTKDIYNNQAVNTKDNAQCINCHAFQNYKTSNMQFHVRGMHGGTVVVNDGEVKKVNLKTGSLISNGVYPAWHPTKKLLAYSVNDTGQLFHAKDNQKVEVQDSASDLILYDVETDKVSVILNDSNSLETFPAWAPDGKTLYFASAHFPIGSKYERKKDVGIHYKDIQYNILRMAFDESTYTFGEPDTVFHAAKIGKSATLPRISPDGKYLLFTLGDYGTFHIWHKSSDLHMIDLETGEEVDVSPLNSADVESYHTWSSNGRWIIFSSRRDDGSYTRPYIAYIDKNGKAHKPFVLPQKNIDHYTNLMLSFNIPEFMVEPVDISIPEFARAIKEEAIQVKMRE